MYIIPEWCLKQNTTMAILSTANSTTTSCPSQRKEMLPEEKLCIPFPKQKTKVNFQKNLQSKHLDSQCLEIQIKLTIQQYSEEFLGFVKKSNHDLRRTIRRARKYWLHIQVYKPFCPLKKKTFRWPCSTQQMKAPGHTEWVGKILQTKCSSDLFLANMASSTKYNFIKFCLQRQKPPHTHSNSICNYAQNNNDSKYNDAISYKNHI